MNEITVSTVEVCLHGLCSYIQLKPKPYAPIEFFCFEEITGPAIEQRKETIGLTLMLTSTTRKKHTNLMCI